MSKATELHLQMQAEQHNRTEAAEQQYREHMAYGELEAATTNTDLQAAMLASLRGMILATGSDPAKIDVVMSGIRYYGEAVRLEMIERRFDKPDTFGAALTDEEKDYITKMHP